MRYREIAAPSKPSMRERLSTVTLYVLPMNGSASTTSVIPMDRPW